MSVVANSVITDCPLHPGKHWAVLDVWPSKFAGIYDCPRGYTESCEHEDKRVETIQIDYWPTPDSDQSYTRKVYVCNICEVTIDLSEADPAQDEAEANV